MTQLEKMQEATLNRLVKIYFKNHKEFCDNTPALKILRSQIISRYEKISNSEKEVSLNKKIGYRGIKISKRAELSRAAFIVSSGLSSYARLTKNKVMLSAVNYCYSDIFRSTENTMLARCRQIFRTAKRTKGLSLISFNNSVLNNLSKKIEEYELLMENKNRVKAQIKKHNRFVHKMLAESINIIEKSLTPLMIMLREIYPKDVQQYFDYNRVRKLPGRKKKRNQKLKSKTRIIKPNILKQKTSEEIIHRFAELAMAE